MTTVIIYDKNGKVILEKTLETNGLISFLTPEGGMVQIIKTADEFKENPLVEDKYLTPLDELLKHSAKFEIKNICEDFAKKATIIDTPEKKKKEHRGKHRTHKNRYKR